MVWTAAVRHNSATMIRITSTLATALLFVVSGCASNAGSPTALLPTSSVQDAAQASTPRYALDRLAPADDFYLSLRFKNLTPNSLLHFNATDFECTAAEPEKIDLRDGQMATVIITADDKGLCSDRDHYLYFDMYFRNEKKSFDGSLNVRSTLPTYDWRAVLERGAREHGLCTIPDGFEHARQLHDDELIEFYLC